MADETARVDYIFTQKGLDAIKREVAALRKELGSSGVDAATFERQLGGIEKQVSSAGQAVKQTTGNLAAQRYALYDLSRTYAIIGTAMAGIGTYAIVMGAQFESAFTTVERTLQTNAIPAEVEAIRQSLIQLSGQIPLTFAEVSQIATIGNQMGIAKDEVIDFTGTVARFASVTGLSIESVTQAFGGFMAQTGLAPQYLENLGSAVAKVGIDSNATEAQIVSLMREIAAGAGQAGFTADQIVGLAGSLASLQIAPERARGSLDTYFGTLNRVVAEGGEGLEKFAAIVGVSADQLDRMVRNGEGADVMRGFLEGLNDLDNVQVTQALDDLGLAQLRVSNTFRRLSNDLGIFDRDQQNAQQAFIAGAELSRQYAMTVDDLNSQWIIFINNLNAIVATISGGAIPGIAGLLTMVNSLLSAFQQWLGDNRWAVAVLAFSGALVTVLGVMALLRGALFAARGAMMAYQLLQIQVGATGIAAAGSLRGVAASFFGVAGAAGTAARAMRIFRIALAATGIGLAVLGIGELASRFMGASGGANDAALSLDEYNSAVATANRGSQETASAADGLADSLGGGGGGGGVGGAATGAAEKIRTLVDYMNDLQGVFGRSSDIRFGSSAAMDEVTLKWIEMNDEVREYMATIRSLTADRELKAYWLGIAEMYDDQIRASQLREEIAKIDDELAEANSGASRELKGNSKAAIENRKRMRDLLGGYENYITALAAAGASQEEIQQVIASLNGDFRDQARELGYSGEELKTYEARFGDLAKIVDLMPRNITIGFNGDPALQAMDEFFARAKEAATGGGGGAGGGFGDGFGAGLDDALMNYDPFLGMGDGAESAGTTIADDLFQGFANWWNGLTPDIKALILGALSPVNLGLYVLFTEEGKEWARGAWEGLKEFFGSLGDKDWWGIFSANLGYIVGYWSNQGVEFGKKIWQGIIDFWTTVTSQMWWDQIKANLSSAVLNALTVGMEFGRTIWNGITNFWAVITTQDWWTIISQALINTATNFLSIGRSMFDRFWQGFNSGASGAKFSINASVSGKGVSGDLGFAGGGFTGRGGKYEPAGIVHRGEHVVPKQYVDQRTGMPEMSYMQSMQRASKAPQTSYASGGYVSGGASGPIELGPASLGFLANALSVRMRVDGRELAKASSRGDKKLARTGSN